MMADKKDGSSAEQMVVEKEWKLVHKMVARMAEQTVQ
jgi:hypothetical protein